MENIIIIGNASTLLQTNLGEQIDNKFKDVVRCNDYVTEGFEKDVGCKTTIWSTGGGAATVPRDSKQYNEVWVSCPSVCVNMMAQLGTRITQGGSFTLMGYNFCKGLETQMQLPPNVYCTSGMYAIGYALTKHQIVHIAGFNFFKDCKPGGNTNHYYGEHATEKVGRDHRMDLEEQFINKLIEGGRVIKL